MFAGAVEVAPEPYADRQEAEEVINTAFQLLRTGQASIQETQIDEGWQLLMEAEQRSAWEVLDFRSWNELMLESIAKHLRDVVMKPQFRRRLAVAMRISDRDQVTLVRIAEAFGVSYPTVWRDLSQARRNGELSSKPAASRPQIQPKPRAPARPDLFRTWINHSTEIARRARALDRIRTDDIRYSKRLPDLARSRGDLTVAAQVIAEALRDFETIEPLKETP
jgi:hypothetical protein